MYRSPTTNVNMTPFDDVAFRYLPTTSDLPVQAMPFVIIFPPLLLSYLQLRLPPRSPHPPYPLRQPHIIRLELIPAPPHQEKRNVADGVQGAADPGHAPAREVVCYRRPRGGER